MSHTQPTQTNWPLPPVDLLLPRSDVHVWRASLNTTPSRLIELHSRLADDERDRAARFHRERDRHHYIVARGGLRTLLGRYLHRSPQDLQFSYTTYGKPALTDAVTAESMRFNLSHSGELVLYAFTWGRELGIDIEWIRPNFARDQIAAQFFSVRENAALGALDASQRVIGFFNCWTRKEAYIKARGQGLSLPLDQFDVSLTPGEPAALLHTYDAPEEASRWSLHALNPGAGYAAALAVEAPDWNNLVPTSPSGSFNLIRQFRL